MDGSLIQKTRFIEYRCNWCRFTFWDLWVHHEDTKYCRICGSPNAHLTFLGKAWYLQHKIEYKKWLFKQNHPWANIEFFMATIGFAFMFLGLFSILIYLFEFQEIPSDFSNGIDFILNAPIDSLFFHPIVMTFWGTVFFLMPTLHHLKSKYFNTLKCIHS